MMGGYFSHPLQFALETISSFYIAAILLRFLFQWVKADSYNPVSQFLIKITHPPLKLLRRVIPAVGRIDTASLVLAFGLEVATQWSQFALSGFSVSPVAVLILSFAALLQLLMNIYVYAILIGAVLSWVAMGSYNAVSGLTYALTEPVLRVCRSVIPDLGAIDLSPVLALFLLHLAKMMILPPLTDLASLLG